MSTAVEYRRPTDLGEALALLARPGAAVLAGGTAVNAGPRPSADLLIDLQALGLDRIESDGQAAVTFGAMLRLSQVAGAPTVPTWLRELARKEQPSSLRTLATVGGTLFSGGWESALLAGLLACDAVVHVAGSDGAGEIALSELLERPDRAHRMIVTAVRLHVDGSAAVHATARTPADRPIVACVARRTVDGVRLAMSGVASVARLVDDVASLTPPGDFRGSADYRRHLAAVLSARALAEIGAN